MVKRNLAVMGLSLVLSACGFQLRGLETNTFALQEIDLQARDSHGALVREVERVLENGGVTVTDAAPFTLDLGRAEVRERAVSYTSAARSAEYELSGTLNYRMLGRNDLPLMAGTLEAQKVYVRDSSNLAASEREAQQLREELRRELVQQLAQRLRRVTPGELEGLQATAEERARVEAEALRKQQQATPDAPPMQRLPR